MNDWKLSIYMREIELQCQVASFAAEQFNASGARLEARDRNPDVITRLFAAAQNLLSAGAAVSRLLWPPDAKTGSTRERAQSLRSALAVDPRDFPQLNSRTVRDSLEHFDERLDRFFEAGHNNVLDLIVGPDDFISVGFEIPILRRLDPRTHSIFVLGRNLAVDEVRILDLVDELLTLKRRAVAWAAQR